MDITNEVLIKKFISEYLNPDTELDIIDIGSKDVNGTYKNAFSSSKWKYVGLDIFTGPNVDIVAKSPYDFGVTKKFDVLVSANTMEHVEDIKLWATHLVTLLKDNALVFFSVPSDFPMEHRHPLDCWRIWPDGLRWVMKQVMELEVINIFYQDRSCFGIGRYHKSKEV